MEKRDYNYEEFRELEECEIYESGCVRNKQNARDFVVNILEKRPFSRNEIEELAKDANYTFDGEGNLADEFDVSQALEGLLKDCIIEARYGDNARLLYGIKHD